MNNTSSSIYTAENEAFKAFCDSHLPEFESLDRLENNWAVFGCLTYAEPAPLPRTQINDFKYLMKLLGMLNHSHPDLLHWFVRVEHSFSGEWHMHFLLGHERVTNGHHTPMTPDKACKFLSANWTHGLSKIERYNKWEDGVGYVTKTSPNAPDGITRMSPALFDLLEDTPPTDRREKEVKRIARYKAEGLDDLAAAIHIGAMRAGIDVVD